MPLKADAMPEDVLDELQKLHLGTEVEINTNRDGRPYTPANGFTILKLALNGTPLLTVREPPTLWPVTVDHHCPDGSECAYSACGPEYVPGRARVDMSSFGTPAELKKLHQLAKEHKLDAFVSATQEALRQSEDSPIDTPKKLFDLCKSLLDGETRESTGRTAALKALVGRVAVRKQRANKPA